MVENWFTGNGTECGAGTRVVPRMGQRTAAVLQPEIFVHNLRSNICSKNRIIDYT